MIRLKSALAISAAAVVCICAPALAKPAHPTRGGSGVVSKPLVPPTAVYYGGVKVSVVTVSGEPFRQAANVIAPATGHSPWDEEIQEKAPMTVTAGQKLVASFYIRAVRPASGVRVTFNAESGPPGYTKSASKDLTLSSRWQHVVVPFTVKTTIAKGTGDYNFFLNYKPSTIQIAGFKVAK